MSLTVSLSSSTTAKFLTWAVPKTQIFPLMLNKCKFKGPSNSTPIKSLKVPHSAGTSTRIGTNSLINTYQMLMLTWKDSRLHGPQWKETTKPSLRSIKLMVRSKLTISSGLTAFLSIHLHVQHIYALVLNLVLTHRSPLSMSQGSINPLSKTRELS